MLEVIKKWQSLFCHWKFFTNIKPKKVKKSDGKTISKEKLENLDYFHISLMEVN